VNQNDPQYTPHIPPEPDISGIDFSGADIFIILGAAVWRGGLPSGAMRRRTNAAIEAARHSPRAVFLPTGGVGRHGPAEALVMRQLLLEAGVKPANILVERHSTDTLSSVCNCVSILRSLPNYASVTICTDRYHLLRTRLLFRLKGIRVRDCPIASGRASTGNLRWLYFYLRDAAALVKDIVRITFSPSCARHPTQRDS
jgi:uncharacterized SAM-binding protein YcdF (DUF218 family)